MATVVDRRNARQLEALIKVEVEVRALVAGTAAAIRPSPADRDDARLAGTLATMPVLRARYAEARGRLRGQSASEAELTHRTRATDTLRVWDRMAAAVAAAAAESDGPLLPPVSALLPPDPVARKLSEAYVTLEYCVNGTRQSEDAAGHGCHPYIALSPKSFAEFLIAAWRLLAVTGHSERARFLEVGAGAGAKLLIAREFFRQADGLEYDQGYFEKGLPLLAGVGDAVRLIEGDALAFADYGAYDVIYLYVPMQDEEAERELEHRIARLARDGAVIIAPHAPFLPATEGLVQVAPDLYVKGVGAAEAAELARLACRAGRDVPSPVPPPKGWRAKAAAPSAGLFSPLVEALGRAGFRCP